MAAASQSDPAPVTVAEVRPISTVRALLSWLAFVLIVAGVRLAFVAHFGSAMPLLDQWDDEGGCIFKPYLDGTLSLTDLFAPHNEHRPVIARLLALTSLVVNGQWDARVQLLLNAGVATLLASAVAWLGIRSAGQRHRSAVLLGVACWSCVPFAWENTTWAFQSSFYFLVLFSLLAIHGCAAHRALSRGWLLGIAAALLACVSMASGFLAAAAVLLMVALRSVTGRSAARDSLATAAACIAIIALALTSRVHVADHDPLRANTIAEFFGVFARSMAWPYVQYAVASLIIQAPIALLAIGYIRRKPATARAFGNDAGAETLLGIAAWVALQSAAIAYARGGGMGPHMIASRYMDILAMGTLVNFLALIGASWRGSAARSIEGFITVLAGGWTAAVFLGALSLGARGFEEMRGRADQVQQAEQHVRAYIATGGIGQLSAPAAAIAYPRADRFEMLLAGPIREILPANIRRPLAIEPEGSSGPFVLQSDAANRRIWNSEAGGASQPLGEMRSQVLHPTLPYLAFELRGRLSERTSLKLQEESSGRQHGVEFARSRTEWREGYAAVTGDLRVIARDDDAERAIAFAEPREVGRLSYYAERVLDRSLYVLMAGIALAVVLAMQSYLTRPTTESQQP